MNAESVEKKIENIDEKNSYSEPEIKSVPNEKVFEEDLSQHHSVSFIKENEPVSDQVFQMNSNEASDNSVPFVNEKPIELEIINAGKTVIKESPQSLPESETKISFTTWLKQFRVNEPQAETEIPEKIERITGFVEAPTISSDNKILYFHKKESSKFALYFVKKK